MEKNPDVISFNIRESERVTDKFESCGDFGIILGLEEMLRRSTENLAEYAKKTPGIPSRYLMNS